MNILIKDKQAVSFVANTLSGFTVKALTGLKLDQYTPAVLRNLIDRDHGPHEGAKFRVRVEASKRIEALEWRIERAKERGEIGAAGETVSDVLREREAIRRASNRLESEIESLSGSEARGLQFLVRNSDWPTNPIVTRLTFMRRFTDAERLAIRTARDNGQSQDLLDFWELLQLATNINLNDADIQAGVAMLEVGELIGVGRAEQITSVP